MKLPAIFALLLLGLAAAPVWAECVKPKMKVSMPDGASASRDAMLSARQALTDYQTSTKSYLSCIAARSDPDPGMQEKARGALREMADRFNVELRKFKEKNGG